MVPQRRYPNTRCTSVTIGHETMNRCTRSITSILKYEGLILLFATYLFVQHFYESRILDLPFSVVNMIIDKVSIVTTMDEIEENIYVGTRNSRKLSN